MAMDTKSGGEACGWLGEAESQTVQSCWQIHSPCSLVTVQPVEGLLPRMARIFQFGCFCSCVIFMKKRELAVVNKNAERRLTFQQAVLFRQNILTFLCSEQIFSSIPQRIFIPSFGASLLD